MDQASLHTLLKFGVDNGASDIHFGVGGPPRYRVKGELLKAKGAKYFTPDAMVTLAEIILGDRSIEIGRTFAIVVLARKYLHR